MCTYIFLIGLRRFFRSRFPNSDERAYVPGGDDVCVGGQWFGDLECIAAFVVTRSTEFSGDVDLAI